MAKWIGAPGGSVEGTACIGKWKAVTLAEFELHTAGWRMDNCCSGTLPTDWSINFSSTTTECWIV